MPNAPTQAREYADLIVRGIDWLITVDERRRVLRDAALAVKDGVFCAIGKSEAICAAWQAPQLVDARGAVAIPGLIDSHLHSSFQLARGLADEANAQAFLFEHMYPYEAAAEADDVYTAASLAASELLRHGVTCFIEPGNTAPDATVRAVMDAGMRMVLGVSCFDRNRSPTGSLPARMVESREQCVEKTLDLFERYPGKYAGRLTVSASFRGMNNASDELILALKEIADRHDAILQTHACYSYFTRDASIVQFARPEIERLESLGVLDARMVLLHTGWLEPHEVEILARRKPNVVCCPSSSLHNGYGNLAQGLHPELMALGVNVGLGADHASSGTVDLIQEMRLCACGYKEIRANPRVMPPEQALEMATVNGARCAGLAARIGSIEIGKAADFVLFDAAAPEWLPLYNPVSNLVYSATGSSVEHVFVGGRQVVDRGRVTTIDQEALVREVSRAAGRIAGRLDMRKMVKLRWPVE